MYVSYNPPFLGTPLRNSGLLAGETMLPRHDPSAGELAAPRSPCGRSPRELRTARRSALPSVQSWKTDSLRGFGGSDPRSLRTR